MSKQKPITQETGEAKILREVAEDYIDSLVFTETKASTIKVYLKSIQLAVDYFGAQRQVDAITLLQVGKFFNSPALKNLPNGKPRAELTVKQIKRVFRQCMDFALEKKWITSLPVPKSELAHARAKATPPAAETPEPAEADAQS